MEGTEGSGLTSVVFTMVMMIRSKPSTASNSAISI
jgi:hypothetical protein